MHQEIITRFNSLKEKRLSIDITRGKPDIDQLDLSNDLLNISLKFEVIKFEIPSADLIIMFPV